MSLKLKDFINDIFYKQKNSLQYCVEVPYRNVLYIFNNREKKLKSLKVAYWMEFCFAP